MIFKFLFIHLGLKIILGMIIFICLFFIAILSFYGLGKLILIGVIIPFEDVVMAGARTIIFGFILPMFLFIIVHDVAVAIKSEWHKYKNLT